VSRDGVSFPLIPRHRLLGLAFGTMHSARRGLGADIAGTRPYRPGDDMSSIDWAASARLSAATDRDEFIVRERFADEAPRVVALCDRRPAMALYPDGLPWLHKPEAMQVALELIATSAFRARGLFGYLDLAGGEPFWRPPRSEAQALFMLDDELAGRPWDAGPDNLARGFDFFKLARLTLPPGSFIFVLSDFLVAPPADVWVSLLEHRWDVVPVLIQDPTWEQTFPPVWGVTLPVADAERGSVGTMRLTRRRARELRERREQRLARLLADFSNLGVEAVVVDSIEEEAVLQAFLGWVDRRLYMLQAWRRGA
jgi:uncharacterized protein (DUF58 family)